MTRTRTNTVSGLEQHLGYWLRLVSNHVSQAFMQKVETQGVTVAEWAVLRKLLEAGPVNPSRIADRMGMTRGAISKLVERLIAKRLVARSVAADDRRFQSVFLTASGQRLVPVLARLADQNDDEFFGHLPEAIRLGLVESLQELVRRHGWKDVPVG